MTSVWYCRQCGVDVLPGANAADTRGARSRGQPAAHEGQPGGERMLHAGETATAAAHEQSTHQQQSARRRSTQQSRCV